jgi:acyl carrier protein/predicted Rdx family selenoprotein
VADKKIIIVDPESLTQCPPDRIGEIWLSGTGIAQGYWNRPEETQITFQAYLTDTGEGPFLRTGDLGFFADDDLVITGRLKDLVIIRGKNYYSQDLERTVESRHPALQPGGGAAFAITMGEEEQLAIMHEVKRDYSNLDADEVIQSIRRAVAQDQELPVYAVALVKAGALPRTPSGKIQRFRCRADFMAGRLDAIKISRLQDLSSSKTPDDEKSGYVAPRTPIERALVGIWAGVLGLGRIGIHDNFFELGGDSLKVTQILSQVQDVFQVELAARSPFDSPTIAGMAAAIGAARQHPDK